MPTVRALDALRLGPTVLLATVLACVGDAPTTPTSSAEAGADTSASTDAAPAGEAGQADSSTAWDPSHAATLVLWLDGDKATKNVDGRVDAWPDRSGKKNDATAATSAQKPVLLSGSAGITGHQAPRSTRRTS